MIMMLMIDGDDRLEITCISSKCISLKTNLYQHFAKSFSNSKTTSISMRSLGIFVMGVVVVALSAVVAAQRQQRPQQQQGGDNNNEFQSVVDAVFGPAPTPAPPRGFGVIVTPEPNVDPTSMPQTLRRDTAEECTCVSYHRCDPANNRIRADTPEDFDGFGVIDVRIDVRECQAVLDVCCKGTFQREETIAVKPVEQRPNRAAGCGIRNVGGIDFQLSGANVSDERESIQRCTYVLIKL